MKSPADPTVDPSNFSGRIVAFDSPEHRASPEEQNSQWSKLHAHLSSIARSPLPLRERLRAIAKTVAVPLQAIAIWKGDRLQNSADAFSLVDLIDDDPIDPAQRLPDLATTLESLCRRCLDTGHLVYEAAPIAGHTLVAIPAAEPATSHGVFVVLQSAKAHAGNRSDALIVQLGQAYRQSIDCDAIRHLQQQDQALRFWTAIQKEISVSHSLKETGLILSTRLAAFFGSQFSKPMQVAIVRMGGGRQPKVLGISGASDVNPAGGISQTLLQATEFYYQDQQTSAPPAMYRWQIGDTKHHPESPSGEQATNAETSSTHNINTKPLQLIGTAFSSHCVTAIPIYHQQQCTAHLFLLSTGNDIHGALPSFEGFFTSFGNVLALSLKTHQSPIRNVLEAPLAAIVKWKSLIVLCALILCGIMLVPISYTVRSTCELATTHKRYLVAPYKGQLAKVFVEPGQIVAPGDTLALMDDRELVIEVAGKTSEQERENKKSQAARAAGDLANAAIANLESQRIAKEIELLQYRLDHREVKSPIEGTIVQGDLDELQGAPVEMGQSLFEVAPLDELIVQIFISEHQIRYVRPGMPVNLCLEAYPFETWKGTVERIHPQAETREENNIFIAEIRLPNPDKLLRPGMKGSAKITADRYPLAWNWLHYPYEKLRQMAGWF